ncbi:MAG: MJ1255/VC2487 family glycosyltransferase [Myxococcota bacterium]
MKILYGVVGEGMGHAMRSRVVLEHLIDEGHEVEIMTSQRAVDYLRERFAKVHRIHGLHIVTEENRVRRGKTLLSNVAKGTAALPRQIASYFELIGGFRPDAVVTDFESWTYFYAKRHRLPVLSIDNQQAINRCKHPPDVLEGYRQDFEVTRAFVKSKLPFCDHYLITTFFFPPVRKERTSLHPPILRPSVLEAQSTRGDHLLVYQTAEGHTQLADILQRTGLECRVYGMRRHITEEQVEGNLRYRPFDERRFIEDLASARAVVSGGGFTLMGEAVYLHKPILSVPITGQFEQILNARYLQHEGYGHHAKRLDATTLGRFLDDVPRCEDHLARYHQDGNQHLFHALDAHLDRAAAGV